MDVYFHSMALDHALETADFERSTQVKTFKSMLPNAFDERSQASDCASGGLRRLRRRRKFAWGPPWFPAMAFGLSLIAREDTNSGTILAIPSATLST